MLLSFKGQKLKERFRLWWKSPEKYDTDPHDVIPHFWETIVTQDFFPRFCLAVLKGSSDIEDQSQVVVEQGVIFCGVYDGHGGSRASTYLVENLYENFRERCKGAISPYNLRNAIVDTENGFLYTVQTEFFKNRLIAANGSSCLVGVLSEGTLHYANIGDSRAVLGYVNGSGNIVAQQLTQDHNINVKEVRREYRASHSGDEDLLVKVKGIWHIKGVIQVTRSIGDECFKVENMALDSTHTDFYIRGCVRWPLLSSEPSVESLDLKPAHRFVIFATKGLWEHVSNREAAEVVDKGLKQGAARRLVRRAMKKKAIKAGMSYEELKAVDIESRREYLDDISVIVLFVDPARLDNIASMPARSIRGCVDEAGPSGLNNPSELDNSSDFNHPSESDSQKIQEVK